MTGRAVALVRLGRPKFLIESMLTVTLGVTVAAWTGHPFGVLPWLTAQAFVTTTHLMTQYCNEYFDLEADGAHPSPSVWTGGSRILVDGVLPAQVGLSTAFVLLFGSVGQLALVPSTAERLLCAAIVCLAWFYTAPPVRLNYRALGEVTTAGVLTVGCPVLACRLQTGTVPVTLIVVTVPLFLVMTARMLVMNFCDRASDRAAGKRTLPNTLGERRAALLFAGLQVVAYGFVLVTTALGTLPLPVGAALLGTAPLAVPVARTLLTAPPSERDVVPAHRLARRATVHAAATTYLAVAGLLVAATGRHVPGGTLLACTLLLAGYTVLLAAQQLTDRRTAPDPASAPGAALPAG